MSEVKVLDCTLRDGGYCNQWKFGYREIVQIVSGLMEANIEIIECGFITNKVSYNKNVSKYSNLAQLEGIIPADKQGKMFVAMMNWGEFNIEDIPACDGTLLDGIRVAFHKKNRYQALDICKALKEKGYKVFVQPMVSLSYSLEEFVEMIEIVNAFQPYAFYIVDSFGVMKSKELLKLYDIVSRYLRQDVIIGYHSHNNMQLAFSNAQLLCVEATNRALILDSSVFGMGRGAGNLNTELFIEYANNNLQKNYQLNPLLEIIDSILVRFYKTNYWGYSLPNYLSASHNAHPNYAGFLDDKNTLTVQDMNRIFEMMNEEKKLEFDKEYIESLYAEYMNGGESRPENMEAFQEAIKGKILLLIAPGKSSLEEQEKIICCMKDDQVVSVSVNFHYEPMKTDYTFISNLRRYRDLGLDDTDHYIVTSNIPAENVYLKVDYKELLCEQDAVVDNAGLMLIKFLMICKCKKILLAGFDGYSHEDADNYADRKMELISKNAVLDAINEGMNSVLLEYSKEVDIQFLTKQKHLKL